MGKKRRGRTVRKNRSQMKNREEEFKSAPHTMVFARGQVGNLVRCLAKDMRTMFEPFTATKLEVKRKNMLKDFVAIAGKLHVSHLIYFTRPPISSESGSSAIYMRMVKCPQGPTLTFRVLEYALRKNVQSAVRRTASSCVYQHPPLQVLQGFSGEGMHLKLVTSMVQNLLPPLNVRTLRLKTVRRVLLWSRASAEDDAEEEEVKSPEELKQGDVIHLRHYSLKVGTRGLSRPLKKLQRKKVPNLAGYADVREWVNKGGALSDSGLSDAESCTDNEVEVSDKSREKGRHRHRKRFFQNFYIFSTIFYIFFLYRPHLTCKLYFNVTACKRVCFRFRVLVLQICCIILIVRDMKNFDFI